LTAVHAPAILDHLAALADPTRSRLLVLLDHHELTVSELCGILQLPQSTVSRHLKALSDSGWISVRAEATSHFYTIAATNLDAPARHLWALVREQVAAGPAAEQDQHRLQVALSERRSKSQEFFASSVAEWDRLRDELFGERFHLAALGALADSRWVAADLGCGTGQLCAALAPFVRCMLAVDASSAMLDTARLRLSAFENVELRQGELEALPLKEGEVDFATLMLVLHHIPEPEAAIGEVSRVLRPGGRVLIVDMLPHDRESYRQHMGHIWLGFSAEVMTRTLEDAGFEGVRVATLPPDSRAKGPALFVATANKHTPNKS
jgi:ubiquinone/menaquinone biosynthesis C-methylase UbiE/DNA-binding transcriptional ArsR family regulator